MFAYKCHVPDINLVLDYEKIPSTYIYIYIIVEGFRGCNFLDAWILFTGKLYA